MSDEEQSSLGDFGNEDEGPESRDKETEPGLGQENQTQSSSEQDLEKQDSEEHASGKDVNDELEEDETGSEPNRDNSETDSGTALDKAESFDNRTEKKVSNGGDDGISTDDEQTSIQDLDDDKVEIGVVKVDYTVENRGNESEDGPYPIVHVFGRTRDGELRHVKVHDFRPYFYVPDYEVDKNLRQDERVTGIEEGFKSINGESLTRVYARIPADVGNIRESYTHYEADILFPNRFRIDKGVKSGMRIPDEGKTVKIDESEVEPCKVDAPTRSMIIDIEVDDRNGFPEEGEEEIICLTCWDSFDDEYVVFGYKTGEIDAEDYVVHSYDTEVEMLDAFIDYLDERDPDLITGWNFEDFDAPYLIDRIDRLNDDRMDPDRLSRLDEVWHSGWGGPTVKGRATFDLLYAYQRMKFTELESYRLDAIAEEELGEAKVHYTGKIGDLWEDDPERLVEYNKVDVELCVEIDRKVDIVNFFWELARFVGCSIEDSTTPSDVVDIYVLRKAYGEFVLPSKGGGGGEEYEGGEVFEPITGIRENVVVLDLACFSGDTQVLTPDGVKNIKEVRTGDRVYTLDPETFECEVDEVVETHEYDNKYGQLHHVSGNTHDFKVTENHRFLVSSERRWDELGPEDFEFEEFRDITKSERYAFPNHEPVEGEKSDAFSLVDEVQEGNVVIYCSYDLQGFRSKVPTEVRNQLDLAHGSSGAMAVQKKIGKYLLPVSTYRQNREVIDEHADEVFLKYARGHREIPLQFEMDDWLELVGWYVTEGSVYEAEDMNRITIHQNEGKEKEGICSLLDRMNINYSVDESGVNVSNTVLFNWFVENCGEGYAEKKLPEFVFDLDYTHLDGLLRTMIEGDSSWFEEGVKKFWTKSDTLKEGFVRIAVRCGHKPKVKEEDDGTWYISVGKNGSFLRETNENVEDHDGKVYCVTAENNHVVLAGREGKFQWVGQSLYPMSMVSINASPETKVGDDYDGEVYEAPNGVKFRKDTEGLTKTIVTELLEEREKKKAQRDEHEYGTDEYEKFDNQQSAIKVVMNCFSGDTDVVTEDGVKNIKQVEVGERVYSIDPQTNEVELKRVTDTHDYDYEDEMIDIETNHTDFSVTPNHRMLVSDKEENRFVEAGNLNDYTNYQIPLGQPVEGERREWFDLLDEIEGETEDKISPDNAYVHFDDATEFKRGIETTADLVYESKRKAYKCAPQTLVQNESIVQEADQVLLQHAPKHSSIPHKFEMDDWLRLVAWYVTEGSVYEIEPREYESASRGRTKKIQLVQIDEEGRRDIVSLLERMEFNPSKEARQISISNTVLANWLVENCGKGSEEKRLPEFVFDLHPEQLEILFETLIAGDGDTYSGISYSTKSDQLKDDVVRLAVHLGYKPLVNRDSGVWRIRFSRNKGSFRMHRGGGTSESDGKVYCVTVEDNHTVLAGRNGKFQWVGQSYYGVSGYSRFRLYDREMGSAVTATGRAVIEYTKDVVDELGYNVVYGDSVTGDRPVVVRDPSDRIRVLPIERIFEIADSSTEKISNVVITSDGGDRFETVDPKDRRALEGWDALSVNSEVEAEWKPIEQVIRHRTDKPVVRMQHKFGESVTTRDHSYVVNEGNSLTKCSPEELEEPLRVDVPEVNSVEAIDVYEVLEGYKREYEDGRGGKKGETVAKTKEIHADDEYVWFGHSHHDEYDSTIKAKRYIEAGTEDSRSLVRLLGAYVAEGSASTEENSSSKYGASIAGSDEEWLENLERDYNRLFENAKVSITDNSSGSRHVEYETSDGTNSVTYSDDSKKLQMMNELSAVFFREFAGQKSEGKRIPDFVYHLPENEKHLFVNTAVEGDGSRKFPKYSDEYSERNFDFETTSEKLAAGMSLLLNQLGKKHSFKYRDEKGSYTVRTCDSYREGSEPIVSEVEHDGYVYDLSVAENQNFVDALGRIALHNTDSTMVELGSDYERKEVIDIGHEIEDEVNESYDEMAVEKFNAEPDRHRWEIEFEKLYRRFFQAGKKKRYAGHLVWNEGEEVDKIDITGFEYKRSDVARVTKEVQEEVIKRIVKGEDFESVASYLRNVIEDFKEGDFDYDYVAIPGGIGQKLDNYDTATAHVKGAKYANEHFGTNFTSGSKPKRLYIKRVRPSDDGEQYPPTEVICFEYPEQVPEEFEVDWDKMLDKTLKKPISRILEALGWSWSEVESGQEQQGLSDFM